MNLIEIFIADDFSCVLVVLSIAVNNMWTLQIVGLVGSKEQMAMYVMIFGDWINLANFVKLAEFHNFGNFQGEWRET